MAMMLQLLSNHGTVNGRELTAVKIVEIDKQKYYKVGYTSAWHIFIDYPLQCYSNHILILCCLLYN